MLVINVIVFAAVFGLVTLILIAAARPRRSERTEAALAAALKAGGAAAESDLLELRVEHRLSSIPWLNRLLTRISLFFSLGTLLSQAGVGWTPGRFVLLSLLVGSGGVYAIDSAMRDFRFALLLGLLLAALPWIWLWTRRSRRFAAMQQKLPEALDLMVSALRAGNSLSGALGVAASEAPEALRREFRLCFEEQNFGIDLRSALRHMLERVPLPDLRMMATAMLIHKESGGNLAEVLEKTAYIVRERARLQQQIRVHTAQGRVSGLVLILLPLALGLTLRVLNPVYLRVLLDRPIGHTLIEAAIVMNIIGLLLIRRIVHIRI